MEEKTQKRSYAKPYVLQVVLTPAENVLANCYTEGGASLLTCQSAQKSCQLGNLFLDPKTAPHVP